MKHNFSFNLSKYDLWEVYVVIKKSYPIGIDHGEGYDIHVEYQGINR